MEQHILSALIQNGLLLACLGWLLKYMVSDKLKTISSDISELKQARAEDTAKIHHIDTRVARIEERHKQLDSWRGPNREVC
jgi:septal ring factor EnvC (AmiA/AmiB activator)